MSRGVAEAPYYPRQGDMPPPGTLPPPYCAVPPAPGFATAPPPVYPPYQQYPPMTAPMYPQHPHQNYGAMPGATTTTIVVPPEVIMVGGCPACRIGILENDYTCLGVLCAILFFPIGIICCLAMKNRRCSNCGAYFG